MKRDCDIFKDNYFRNMLKTFAENKKIYIWSACYKSDWMWKLCESINLKIDGYIDKRAAEIIHFHNLKVFEPDDILGNKDCFIFVALENIYTDVLNMLKKYGLKEFHDYLYPGCSKIVLVQNNQKYRDFNGNEIIGDVNGFQVVFCQGGSKLIIGNNCNIDRNVLITLSRNATVIIGDNCVIRENSKIECSENAVIKIGKNSDIGKELNIRVNCDSVLIIGEHFTSVKNLWIRAEWKSVCVIGKDCMFARNIELQCMDAHNYYDLDKNINLNSLKRYKIIIGKHVWLGADCKLLYGANIGAGSMVGMGSFVNKKFPNNVVIAGNPAKCIRKNVAWNRDNYPYCDNRENYESFDYREKVVEGNSKL